MATVGDVVGLFDVSKQTVRYWVKEFDTYLSSGANPPKGKTRFFTEDDMEVLSTVAQMREKKTGYEGIHIALANGERQKPPVNSNKTIENADIALAPIEIMEQFAERLTDQYQGQIGVLEGERDYLRDEIAKRDNQLKTERIAYLESVERATKAETMATMLQAQLDQLTSSPPPPPSNQDNATAPPSPRRWWHIFKQ